MSARYSSPTWSAGERRPDFGRASVTVASARTVGSSRAPVVASRPDGTSRLSIGAELSLARRMRRAVGPRGAPRRLQPASASMMRSASGIGGGSSRWSHRMPGFPTISSWRAGTPGTRREGGTTGREPGLPRHEAGGPLRGRRFLRFRLGDAARLRNQGMVSSLRPPRRLERRCPDKHAPACVF